MNRTPAVNERSNGLSGNEKLEDVRDARPEIRQAMERAASLELLRKHVSPREKPTLEIGDVGGALEKAMGEAGREDLVVVTGSLYTVGEARAYLIRKGLIQN